MATTSKGFLEKAREEIYKITGIHLADNKDSLILNRIEKLARELKISDYDEILKEVSLGKYRQEFINAFTTNKTDFFREPFHFTDMMDRVLPRLCREKNSIKIYCSASSTGEEPYSIAATLLHAKEVYRCDGVPASIIATDIDTNVLDFAQKGQYKVDTLLNKLPTWLELDRYFEMKPLEGEKSREIQMNAKACLKSLISFKTMNLFSEKYPFARNEFDVIFCRNVLIYFKVEDQKKVLERLFSHLKVGGTLYLGHSENILTLQGRVDRLGQNIFVKNRD
ncbi:CheR family methyltransferase [Wolinella succinogenes]|uniref:protein-glutamate O-methyltransferase n=1 Tax=Wolinella succinogenes (strain ATCC 29543 / DSM 1740 / CCUG 13145 / JCM 31913 / LMG 7466 / NCTC 11488 / FDC 602W) TaxID=273121 RepID=Q7M942_WOLSU|nr:protein-glutamate O-methyltransferase CheR [Wolinella succinogenes]NLU33521.1 protein-glutamate O-methyltransferase CheR [Wolinella succinogenes]CAE10294.1 RESPONSE REGULATOR FOR CHEMOTAXIS, PROTEIN GLUTAMATEMETHYLTRANSFERASE [Wolinella succinogenes]VEG80285.1 Chemotaxis protein methyltransferase [Wolinella succinogenes]HCZ19834.1 protein-glutamate O-methyltransferase CheR [Helicobacter sp.]